MSIVFFVVMVVVSVMLIVFVFLSDECEIVLLRFR